MKKLIALITLACLAVSTLGLTISWSPNDPTEQITHYRVYWAQGQGAFTLLADTGTATKYTITNAAPGVYRFYVTAVNFWTDESDPSLTNSTPPLPTQKMKMIYAVIGSKTNSIINLQ